MPSTKDDARITISNESETFYDESVILLEKHWRETSHAIQALRDNQSIADSELAVLSDTNHKGLFANESFDEKALDSLNISSTKPKVAILREQGVNGQMEMAAAFTLAGFDAVDVHMQDLLDNRGQFKRF